MLVETQELARGAQIQKTGMSQRKVSCATPCSHFTQDLSRIETTCSDDRQRFEGGGGVQDTMCACVVKRVQDPGQLRVRCFTIIAYPFVSRRHPTCDEVLEVWMTLLGCCDLRFDREDGSRKD